MEEAERYLGGFYSPVQLALSKFRVGAGIYCTNKKLVLATVGGDLDETFKKIVTGSGRQDFDPSNLTPEQNQAIVKELLVESPKRFVLTKEQISTLELKQPPGIFRTGYLKIFGASGQAVQLFISKKREYDLVLSLLQSFYPQVLKQETQQ